MSRALRIAVASGKGGTGKTTVATNLAFVLAEAGSRVTYVDCDVEEPNGHLFLNPLWERSQEVCVPTPEVDLARCTFCGACARACRYSAIVTIPGQVLTFPKLCHGCGGCSWACPAGALREVERPVGVLDEGRAGKVAFLRGTLNVGEAMAPPVIRALLAAAPSDDTLVIDAPPGTSCPVIESVRTADVVLLVTEPTPFGLHDLTLAVAMVRTLGIPFGVVVNRVGVGDDSVFRYCADEGISVLLQLPNDRAIARAYSRGELAVAARLELWPRFLELLGYLRTLADAGPRDAREVTAGEPLAPMPDARLPSELVQLGKKKPVRELVVISGKGGTGKTSIVASFVALAKDAAIADCDVDAADLHLVLDPAVRERRGFSGGHTAVIAQERCTGCGLCSERCRFQAIDLTFDAGRPTYRVAPTSCEGCGVCVDACPSRAIQFVPTANGEWFVSETRFGPLVHARLGVAQENSGKLVSLVRREAKALAVARGRELLISDGSPGIGCPVIASVAGADLALIVAEPTLAGLHDLERVAELCEQLGTRAAVCVNKADINSEISRDIEACAARRHMPMLGSIHYDDAVTMAQVKRRPVVEHDAGPAAQDVRALFERVVQTMTERAELAASTVERPTQ
jgi:MinD superfamily P-loop ATPase